MNIFITLTAILAVAAALPLSEKEEQEWQNFKLSYEKHYASEDEENLRKEVFVKNLQKFEAHNEKYEKGLVSYTMGVNQFADMTDDEFVNTLAPSAAPSSGGLPFTPSAGVQAPSAKDWRESGAVAPVQNQQNCGSCYAFSSVATLEGHLFIKNRKLLRLSEQNLVDCSQSMGNNGCNGGHPSNSFRYIQSNGGINPESSYPYEDRVGQCRYNPQIPGGTARGFMRVNNENDLLEAVGTVGPVSIGVNGEGLKSYSGGVFDGPCSANLNHGVVVVGYGTSSDGKPYWIIKNSWGPGWGERGFARIIRNRNQCGIGPDGVYPLV